MFIQDIEKISNIASFRVLGVFCLQVFTFAKPFSLSLLCEFFSQRWALQFLAGSDALIPQVPRDKITVITFAN